MVIVVLAGARVVLLNALDHPGLFIQVVVIYFCALCALCAPTAPIAPMSPDRPDMLHVVYTSYVCICV